MADQKTVEQLLTEWNKASASFDNRGDHGGSPGEGAWERMQEIETELRRRGVKTHCVLQQVFPFNTGHPDIDLLEIPPYMTEPEAGKLFRQGEVAAEEAVGLLPDEQVLKTTLAQCPHPPDTREQWWWWLGYSRYMHRHQAVDLKKSLEEEHQRLTQEYQGAVDKQDRINELERLNHELRQENDRLKATDSGIGRVLEAIEHLKAVATLRTELDQAKACITEMEGAALLDNEDRCKLHEFIRKQQARIVELETQGKRVCESCGHQFNLDMVPVERPCPRCAKPAGPLSEYLFNISPNEELEGYQEELGELGLVSVTHFLVLVKKSYWQAQHHLDDRHLTAADPVLADAMQKLDLGECMDSTFDIYDANQAAELPEKLQALGMSTDPELDEFCRTHHP